MVLKRVKKVDNKVSEKKYDKKKRSKTNETDCEIESDLSPSSNVFGPVMTSRARVPYHQALDAPFPTRKDRQREDILEAFRLVQANPPLLEAIKQISAYAKFLKDMCTFKIKSKDDKSQKVFLCEKLSSV